MESLDQMAILTKELLQNGIDYEVTLKGSEVRVRLLDMLTNVEICSRTKGSLEEALSAVVVHAATRLSYHFNGLSQL